MEGGHILDLFGQIQFLPGAGGGGGGGEGGQESDHIPDVQEIVLFSGD